VWPTNTAQLVSDQLDSSSAHFPSCFSLSCPLPLGLSPQREFEVPGFLAWSFQRRTKWYQIGRWRGPKVLRLLCWISLEADPLRRPRRNMVQSTCRRAKRL
jgi:hypothetical protein